MQKRRLIAGDLFFVCLFLLVSNNRPCLVPNSLLEGPGDKVPGNFQFKQFIGQLGQVNTIFNYFFSYFLFVVHGSHDTI